MIGIYRTLDAAKEAVERLGANRDSPNIPTLLIQM